MAQYVSTRDHCASRCPYPSRWRSLLEAFSLRRAGAKWTTPAGSSRHAVASVALCRSSAKTTKLSDRVMIAGWERRGRADAVVFTAACWGGWVRSSQCPPYLSDEQGIRAATTWWWNGEDAVDRSPSCLRPKCAFPTTIPLPSPNLPPEG